MKPFDFPCAALTRCRSAGVNAKRSERTGIRSSCSEGPAPREGDRRMNRTIISLRYSCGTESRWFADCMSAISCFSTSTWSLYMLSISCSDLAIWALRRLRSSSRMDPPGVRGVPGTVAPPDAPPGLAGDAAMVAELDTWLLDEERLLDEDSFDAGAVPFAWAPGAFWRRRVSASAALREPCSFSSFKSTVNFCPNFTATLARLLSNSFFSFDLSNLSLESTSSSFCR
mmetsp:Transcript_57402/g.136852  ORF Transcript_57402/g.136852 Transcript_57402/m.136852 type:complete len:228 (-) Transcript_57402:585-1268(-)